ncbi:redoxin family protein [Stenotrophomonas maltophilia]|uniref:Thioredoxin n=1 Tax=Stenotrophomonas maltophilia TaxID=40324 RepID=A0AB34TMW5_STEMA|nr:MULTISPECIES: redoxin family protein [Stenotrophomonas]KAA3601073.1 thioredoxin [Stenotrophomonas maltophilia]KOO78112.1 thioredoxin [Stenotrophomonas maltophilia]KOO84358.1 thioredoxin [Stenotrophomonas maltophilia]MBN5125792.1 redoxin family protein [Stenotrophomonas maltophilia]MBN5176246.1 redoxin family protein [Stenotrophomonas maltophilia]
MTALRAYALPLLMGLLGGAALLMAWPSPEADAQPAQAVPAAGFDGGGPWHNSPPLTLEQLRGQVVLVEFWTYTCSNCLNVAPYVHQWHARYAPQGLRVIGVHTPEFAYEGLPGNVRKAITRLDITWPVVQDNQYRIWNTWGNRFWPALYLLDRQGRVVYRHYGEGDYARTETEIQRLLASP